MNIVYLLGIVLAFVFVIFGITFDPGGTGGLMVGPFNLDTLINFVDPTSILIVLGGTLAVVVACYPKLAKSFPKHFKIMLRLDAFNPEQYVEKLTELAQIARKNGLLALEEKAKEQFGHLITAFSYGAPPHGGLAYGLDRLCMLMAGAESIRDVIAFPKVQNAGEPMSGAPDVVDEQQLKDLSIALTLKD